MTYPTDGSFEEQIFSRDYPGVSGGELLDAFMPDVEGVFSMEAPDAFLQKVAETASSDGTFASSHVQGAFAMAIVGGRQTYGWKIGAPLCGFGSIDYTFTAGKNPLGVSLPVSSDDVAVYVVTGTHGGTVQTVRRLSAHVVDGYAQVSLNDSDVQISNFVTLMYRSAVGASGLDNLTMEVKPLTDNSEVAYLVVVEPAETPVGKPTTATGLVYNGMEQIGVAEGGGYDLVSNSATNAGTYTTIAMLKEGYVWSDGTADPVVLTWSIGKAILTASYQSRTITVGQTPALAVDVNGFVNGEDASTAAGYEAPTASVADSFDEGTYEITPRSGNADNYQFAYVGGTLTVKTAKKLEPGTYTVTANLAMPGQFNPLVPGLTVYANSPDNPFGPTIDENDPAKVTAQIPSKPLSMNAKLIVAADGTRTLVLPIENPIFTTQDLGASDQLANVHTEHVAPTAGGGDWNGSYNQRTDRIHMMSAELPAGQSAGTATFTFKGSVLYAVPLDKELAPTGGTALVLTVGYDSLFKESDSTELPAFVQDGNGSDNNSTSDNSGSSSSDNGGTNNSGNGVNAGGSNGNAVNGFSGGIGEGLSGSDIGDKISSVDGHLAAGTYTVSANIWVDRSEAGLPLSPHFTNTSFPPSTSVSKNATLTVEPDGHAYVVVPIVIQSRIMHVKSLWAEHRGRVVRRRGWTDEHHGRPGYPQRCKHDREDGYGQRHPGLACQHHHRRSGKPHLDRHLRSGVQRCSHPDGRRSDPSRPEPHQRPEL